MPMQHAVSSATLADVLERVLDKGVVIAGDIKIKLVDIELLTIQVRLLIASVDRAREMGLDWWMTNPSVLLREDGRMQKELEALRQRIPQLESLLSRSPGAATPASHEGVVAVAPGAGG